MNNHADNLVCIVDIFVPKPELANTQRPEHAPIGTPVQGKFLEDILGKDYIIRRKMLTFLLQERNPLSFILHRNRI